MPAELLYEVARHSAGAAGQPVVERLQVYRHGETLLLRSGDGIETAGDTDDPAALIISEAGLSEVRADQVTRVVAAPSIAAVLPLILTVPGDPDEPRVLYVNDDRWAPFPAPGGADHLLPVGWPALASKRFLLQASFVEAGVVTSANSAHHATRLGPVTPAVLVDTGQPAPAGGGTESVVRVWRRGATPRDEAQAVVSWLHGNTLSDRLGIDTDMLVHLFIETAVNSPRGAWTCDGELLATLAAATEYAGTTPGSKWCMTMQVAPQVIEAVLEALGDSSPQWRYAIIAAQDPDSPAGRVRQALLADLDG